MTKANIFSKWVAVFFFHKYIEITIKSASTIVWRKIFSIVKISCKFQELFSFSTKVCGTFRDHSLNVKSRKYILLDTAKKSYVLSACVIRTRNFGFYVLQLIIILTGEFDIHNDIKYQVSNSF